MNNKPLLKLTSARETGSVLMVAILTITVLTFLCATSLYVTSQDASATTQTTSWQQSLSAAEGAADIGFNALNTGNWSNWFTVTGTIGWTQPSGGVVATGAPGTGKYNYYIPPAMALQGEASNSMTTWVAVTPVAEKNNVVVAANKQPYRIRAVGMVGAPGPARVSNQKRDNDLRKIALIKDRLTGNSVGTQPLATRRIELVAMPTSQSIWTRPLTAVNSINMSGGGFIDSFDSSNNLKSVNGKYPTTSPTPAPGSLGQHGDVATTNSTNSDLKSTNVYGSLQYSGPAVKNTTNVKGTISTPFSYTPPAANDPVGWTSTATYSGLPASGVLVAGNGNGPTYYKINGNLTIPGGTSLYLQQHDTSAGDQIYIWVTGDLTTSGSGYMKQDSNVNVHFIVDGNVTVSGSSFQGSSSASALSITATGNNTTTPKFTVSGGGVFTGTVLAPKYNFDISGSSDFIGSFIGNSFNISGGASVHYDEALAGGGSGGSTGNYAYGSWFEDNSDPARGLTY